MNNQIKEEENKNNESDYIIFHFNQNNIISKKISQYSSQTNINNSNQNLENYVLLKENNININKEDNSKSPFTNLILREKLNSAKLGIFNNVLRNVEKLKLKINKSNLSNNNNSDKGFLIINKYETSVQKENNKVTNATCNKILLKDNSKKIKNTKSNLDEKPTKDAKKKIIKVSTGQQTFMNVNFRNDVINNIEYNYNYNHIKKKNNNIVNIPIRNNKFTRNSLIKSESESEKMDINPKINNNLENSSSSPNVIYLENQKIKNESPINKFMKSQKDFNYNNKDIFESFYLNDMYSSSNNTNNSNYIINKTHRLIKNKSNIVNFNDVKINGKKNFMSIRELYRLMILEKAKKDKKKTKSILKQKSLNKNLKKKNEKTKNKYKVFNSNLISLEQYTYEKMKKKKELNNKIKINDNNGKRILHNKIPVYYRENIRTNSIKKSKNELNENIFNNIMRSLSSENNNKLYQEKNKKRFHINILTMLELNNKIKNKNS